MVKSEPIFNQNRSNIEPTSSQNRAGRPHGSSRWLQDGLRTANLATKTPKWSPTWPQDDHKKTPREAQRTSWDHLGASWRLLGRLLGQFFIFFCNFEQYAKIAKNNEKQMVFHRFSRFWESSRVRKIKKIDENWLKEAKRMQK